MTRPIAVRPGATIEITQQTHNREFRFKPTPVVREICMYLLVYSLREYGMQLYGVLFKRREHVRAYAASKKDLRKERRKPMHLRKHVTFPPGTFKLWRSGFVSRKATTRCGPLPTYSVWLGMSPRRHGDDEEPPDHPATV